MSGDGWQPLDLDDPHVIDGLVADAIARVWLGLADLQPPEFREAAKANFGRIAESTEQHVRAQVERAASGPAH